MNTRLFSSTKITKVSYCKQWNKLVLIFILSTTSLFSQGQSKKWDKRYGGNNSDDFTEVIKTTDGGFLMGGSSASGISGDKSQNSQGGNDFWIIKTDSAGNKKWNKRFGGSDHDYLTTIIQTQDGGYLLGGNSLSDISGDKTTANQGGRDIWLVKISITGAKQWDKRFGGTGNDDLSKLTQLSSGDYILAGNSDSPAGGDKSEDSWGSLDFWVLRLDKAGNKKWDKRFGGTAADFLAWLVPTADNNLILGGESKSGISGDKTQATQGSNDYWILKIDNTGMKLWDKRFGGSSDEYLNVILPTAGGNFLLGGESKSGISGDKTQATKGGRDFWLIKINSKGTKQWDKSYGGTAEEYLNALVSTNDGGYLLGGTSASGISGDKSQSSQGSNDLWVVKTDESGIKQWDQRWGGSSSEVLNTVIKTTDESYLIGGYTQSGNDGDVSQPSKGGRDFWLVKMKEKPPVTTQWESRFGGADRDNFTTVIKTPDGGFLLGGNSLSGISGDKTQESQGNNDFWIVKTNSNGTKEWDKRFGGSGHDALNTIITTADGGYLLGGDSESGVGGDKTQGSLGGKDYWIVKINGSGAKQWDRRFGSSGTEELKELLQLANGEYVLAGRSDSPAGGTKSQSSHGGQDYWVIKVSNSGAKIWDKRFGGSLNDYLEALELTSDGKLLLGGYSASGISGEKSQEAQGGYDYWLVKVDVNGTKQWDRRFGGIVNDYLTDLIKTSDNNYVLGGFSASGISGNKTQAPRGKADYWLIKINGSGSKLWDKRYGGSLDDNATALIQTTDGGFLLGGRSLSGISGDKSQGSQGNTDFWVVKTNNAGVKQWDQRFGGSAADELRTVLETTDGRYVLAGFTESPNNGNITQPSRGERDFWMINVKPANLTDEKEEEGSPGILSLSGASDSTFNPLQAKLTFNLKNATFSSDPKDHTLSINGKKIPGTNALINNTSFTTDLSLNEGLNEISFYSLDSNLKMISGHYKLWAGKGTLPIKVVAKNGSLISNAQVQIALGDDKAVKAQGIAANGFITFQNIPFRTIIATAKASGNLFGTAATVGGGSELIVSLIGFNPPSNIDNNDFSLGTQGWNIGNAPVQIITHQEGNIKPGILHRKSTGQNLNNAALDQDLRLSTSEEGPQTISRTYVSKKGTKEVTARYRFITSEVPGGYFNSEYNDYFSISIRSSKGSQIASEQNNMNNLGLDAFEYATGTTAWRKVSLPVNEDGDIIQVDVVVANVEDGAYDSHVEIDFIEESKLKIVKSQLYDKNILDPELYSPLKFLSIDQDFSYFGGKVPIYGTLEVKGDASDILRSIKLEVWQGGVKINTADLVSAAGNSLYQAFGSDEKVEIKTPQLLFELPPSAPLNNDGFVQLYLRAESEKESPEPEQYASLPHLRLFKETSDKYRYFSRNEAEGGDGWGTPSTVAQADYIIANNSVLNWKIGDISNMNAGIFKPHSAHKEGREIDVDWPSPENIRDANLANQIITFLKNNSGVQDILIYWQEKEEDEFWKTISKKENEWVLDKLVNRKDHYNHLHIRCIPNSQSTLAQNAATAIKLRGPRVDPNQTGNQLAAGSAKFSIISPNPIHLGQDKLNVKIFNSASGDLKATVYDMQGIVIKEIYSQPVKAGEITLTWDGLKQKGELVNPGIYFLKISNSSGNNATHRILVR